MKHLDLRKKIKNSGYTDIEKHPMTVWLGTALITVIILEMLSRKSLFGLLRFMFITPHLFLINFMIVASVYSPMLLVKRWGFVRSAAAMFWGIIGVVDFVLLLFRTTPFTWHDLNLIDSAMQIMNHYVSGIGYAAIIAALILCVLLLVFLYRKAARRKSRVNYTKGLACVLTCVILTTYFWFVGKWSEILPRNFSNIGEAYQTYGLAYCFTNSFISTGISKPDDYDNERVENILNEEVVPEEASEAFEEETEPVTLAPVPEETKQPLTEYDSKVNIIYLQLESFFDLTELNDVELSEDPIPVFHKIFDQCSSGFLSVPSVGAGTANTEFEILTGMNLDFFGCGEYPYQTVLREQTCESLPFVYDKIGYTSHAIHNNSATFYNRNMVFSRLGFNTFTSLEYMYGVNYSPEHWAKDKVLTPNILQALKQTEGSDFIYTISVQGHGSYPTDPVLENPKIRVKLKTEDESRTNQLTYYANQLNEMDMFLGELTAALETFDEPCIVVMYGDHLPSLGIEEAELNHGNLFQTKYAVWSNYQMEKNDVDVEAYQLGAMVMKRMGIQEGIMFRYHQKYFQDGKVNETSYLDSMAIIEYDMIYGDQTVFDGENPYKPTNLKMGTMPIELYTVNYSHGDLTLNGTNFNEFSIVIIDGKQYVPDGVSRSRLVLKEVELKDGATILIAQQDDYGKTILSTTGEYVYHEKH